MTRTLRVAAAQLGPIQRADSRHDTVNRLIVLLRQAAEEGAELIIFPELALTSFFPHWEVTDPAEFRGYFETAMPNPDVQPLFEEARRLNVAFSLGYAELDASNGEDRFFNTAILVDRLGNIVGKYRKIHLPGYDAVQEHQPFQNLEKMYFRRGDLGFPVFDLPQAKVGMCICNDRRWPETYRLLALKGAELIVLGYNTPVLNPETDQTPEQRRFHNHLCMQAGAYQNSAWVVAAAKCGIEEGVDMIAGTCIISPSGLIVAETQTLGDEVIVATCDMALAVQGKTTEFDFAKNRVPHLYEGLC